MGDTTEDRRVSPTNEEIIRSFQRQLKEQGKPSDLKSAHDELERIYEILKHPMPSREDAFNEAVSESHQKYFQFKQKMFGKIEESLSVNVKPFLQGCLYLPTLFFGFLLIAFLFEFIRGSASANFFDYKILHIVIDSVGSQSSSQLGSYALLLLVLGSLFFPFMKVKAYMKRAQAEEDAQYDVVVRVTYRTALEGLLWLFGPIIFVFLAYAIFGKYSVLTALYPLVLLARDLLRALAVLIYRIKILISDSLAKKRIKAKYDSGSIS